MPKYRITANSRTTTSHFSGLFQSFPGPRPFQGLRKLKITSSKFWDTAWSVRTLFHADWKQMLLISRVHTNAPNTHICHQSMIHIRGRQRAKHSVISLPQQTTRILFSHKTKNT